jgi:hypothetical protein
MNPCRQGRHRRIEDESGGIFNVGAVILSAFSFDPARLGV